MADYLLAEWRVRETSMGALLVNAFRSQDRLLSQEETKKRPGSRGPGRSGGVAIGVRITDSAGSFQREVDEVAFRDLRGFNRERGCKGQSAIGCVGHEHCQ